MVKNISLLKLIAELFLNMIRLSLHAQSYFNDFYIFIFCPKMIHFKKFNHLVILTDRQGEQVIWQLKNIMTTGNFLEISVAELDFIFNSFLNFHFSKNKWVKSLLFEACVPL